MDIMVDLETLGNEPQTGVIIAIGAVAFNIDDDDVPYPSEDDFASCSTEQMFYVPVDAYPQVDDYRLLIELETLSWWLEPSRIDQFIAFMNSPHKLPLMGAFIAFKTWIEMIQHKQKGWRLWSHGSTYDCMHLAQKWPRIMHESFNRICPFHCIRDTRTLFNVYDVKYTMSPYPDVERKRHHHPLEDSWFQATAVQIAWNGLIRG